MPACVDRAMDAPQDGVCGGVDEVKDDLGGGEISFLYALLLDIGLKETEYTHCMPDDVGWRGFERDCDAEIRVEDI